MSAETASGEEPEIPRAKIGFFSGGLDLYGPIEVQVEEEGLESTSATDCAEGAIAAFEGADGPYSFTAVSNLGFRWEGTFDFHSGECTSIALALGNLSTNRTQIFAFEAPTPIPVLVSLDGGEPREISALMDEGEVFGWAKVLDPFFDPLYLGLETWLNDLARAGKVVAFPIDDDEDHEAEFRCGNGAYTSRVEPSFLSLRWASWDDCL
ncbi:hypothetical protein AKJ08_3271 [Vulgatibacter incomptus]|uniref:Uncharacterized protein n=1 Tax=Vulgatibacter incomptus TaxID=1391653 RepID=A0A0K1PIE4_9BACT|nr:hypothetical protein AKJ08_3271 [Vulgatibacter incomptus]